MEFDLFQIRQARRQLRQLVRGFLHMRTRHDQPAVLAMAVYKLFARKQGPVRHPAQQLGHGGGRTEHKSLARRTCLQVACQKDLHILVGSRVDHHFSKVLYAVEQLRYAIRIQPAQHFQRNAGGFGGRVSPIGLFLAPLIQPRMRIAKRPVPGKLRLPGGNQPIALLDIVDVPQRVTASLTEEGTEDLAVVGLPAGALDLPAQRFRFQGEVPAQRGVAPADNHKGLPRGPGRLHDAAGDLLMHLAGLLLRHAAGIGEQEKHAVFLLKSFQNALVRPIRINVDTMHGLDPRGIVVDNDDFIPLPCQRLFQQSVGLFGLRWRIRVQYR